MTSCAHGADTAGSRTGSEDSIVAALVNLQRLQHTRECDSISSRPAYAYVVSKHGSLPAVLKVPAAAELAEHELCCTHPRVRPPPPPGTADELRNEPMSAVSP